MSAIIDLSDRISSLEKDLVSVSLKPDEWQVCTQMWSLGDYVIIRFKGYLRKAIATKLVYVDTGYQGSFKFSGKIVQYPFPEE